MPELQTELFGRKATIELSDNGEIENAYYTETGAEININSFAVRYNRRLQYEIEDYMNEWRNELRDYKTARGRDRLDE